MTDVTEQRLLEAAGVVFAEKGFKAATVRDIVAQAGLKNIAAVNYYFGDKEKLYDATLRYAFKCGLDQLPAPQWVEGTPPEQKFRQFVRGVVHHMFLSKQHPWQMRLMLRELGEPSEIATGMVRDFLKPIYATLWGILREILGAELDESKLHLIGFSIIGQAFYHRIGEPVLRLVVGPAEHDGYDPDRLAEHIADFSLAALGVGTLSGPKGQGVAS